MPLQEQSVVDFCRLVPDWNPVLCSTAHEARLARERGHASDLSADGGEKSKQNATVDTPCDGRRPTPNDGEVGAAALMSLAKGVVAQDTSAHANCRLTARLYGAVNGRRAG